MVKKKDVDAKCNNNKCSNKKNDNNQKCHNDAKLKSKEQNINSNKSNIINDEENMDMSWQGFNENHYEKFQAFFYESCKFFANDCIKLENKMMQYFDIINNKMKYYNQVQDELYNNYNNLLENMNNLNNKLNDNVNKFISKECLDNCDSQHHICNIQNATQDACKEQIKFVGQVRHDILSSINNLIDIKKENINKNCCIIKQNLN